MGENEKSAHSLLKVCMINMHYYAGNFLFFYSNSRNLAPCVKCRVLTVNNTESIRCLICLSFAFVI